MDASLKAVVASCLKGAESNTMDFPQIVGTLMQHGFEGYAVDFRRAEATYYKPDGDSITLRAHRPDAPVAAAFDTGRIHAAIREAQQKVPSYTYRGFCEKVMAAGCAGYMVSFTGRRALYFG